jgi:hypothetical protein
MTGGEISGNVFEYDFGWDTGGGGGVYSRNAVFTMTGGEISDNTSARYGGGVYIHKSPSSASAFEMSGDAVISGNMIINPLSSIDAYGGGVYNVGTMILRGNAKISENEAKYGGGVYSIGALEICGGEISDNSASSGGGVYSSRKYVEGSYSAGTFAMYGGKINRNTAVYDGGGVNNSFYSTFAMTSGEICGNEVITVGMDVPRGGGGVMNYGMFTMTGGMIGGTESDRANSANNGGGVYNAEGGRFTLSGDAMISGNTATATLSYGGGVYNDYATFTMNGGRISSNTATSYGGGVANYASTFTMNEGEISGNTATSYGGGVFNYSNSAFTMNNGEISGNKATGTTSYGGGVANYSSTFTMNNGEISGNKASLGGGVHNINNGTIEVKSGKIAGNTATGTDTKGSGGGIYTTDFSKLTVADGVIFSGNTAATLRTQDITDTADIDGNGTKDVTDYSSKIGTVVLSDFVLNALAGPNKNAPAYNSYDINYPGDVYVVTVDIYPEGSGSVTVKNTADSMTVYGVLTENGYVLVPIAAASITFSADAENDYIFAKFVIDDTDNTDNPADISVTGNMHVTAVFETVSPPSPPNPNSYTITSSARDGASISPTGNISVREGENVTFSFRAGPGYRISSVYADGSPIPAEALASGTYAFYDVRNNHTIEAIGTPYAASPDSGSGEGGSGSGGSESGRGNSGWAVLNLVFALIATAAGIFAVIAGRNRYKEEDKDNSSRERLSKRFIPEIASLILGIVSVIVFFVTEDVSLPPIVADIWTVLMLVLAIAALASAFLSFRYEEENLEDWNTDTEYV